MEAVGEPADGKRLAAPRRVIDEVLPPDVPRCGEVCERILRHFADHAALVVAGQDREGRTLRLILLCLAPRYADEEEGEHLQQLLLREDFAVKEFDRILA